MTTKCTVAKKPEAETKTNRIEDLHEVSRLTNRGKIKNKCVPKHLFVMGCNAEEEYVGLLAYILCIAFSFFLLCLLVLFRVGMQFILTFQ